MNQLVYEYYKLRSRSAENPPKHLVEIVGTESESLFRELAAISLPVDIKRPVVADLSKWEIVTDWVGMSPRPALVVLRATYGYAYIDPLFAAYIRGSRQAGYPTWAYHFFLYTQNWRSQADTYLRTVKAQGITPDFKPVFDIEGYLPSGMSRATANGMIENWLSYVENTLGKSCVLYSSRNYLNQLYAVVPPAWLTNPSRLKWVAGYPNDPNLYSDMPIWYRPVGMPEDPALWQYSDKARFIGITGAVDVSDMSDWYEAIFSNPVGC